MTSFGYWQGLANEAERFLCMICFEGFPLSDAYEDEYGDKWDTCKPCEAIEQEMILRKEANDPSSSDAGRARTDPR